MTSEEALQLIELLRKLATTDIVRLDALEGGVIVYYLDGRSEFTTDELAALTVEVYS